MNLEDYINLTDEQQTDEFWEHCRHLDTVVTMDAEYQLYSLFKFYVELTLTPDGKVLQRFSPFSEGERLDKYPKDLEQIKKPWE